MTHHIYFRILGYIITIVMHISNTVIMHSSFHGEAMKNDYVRHFSEMQCFFFTCWTFIFQTIYSIVALYTDILTLKNSKVADYALPKVLVDCRDAIFTILVWPSTMFVFTMFWTFFYYDRNLLFPKDIDLVITTTSNHIMHTYILPATLWEVMFRPRTSPTTHTWHLLCVLLIEVIYMSVLLAVYAFRGVWVYPIFSILTGSVFFYLFFVFVAAELVVIYYTQWTLNSVIWRSRENYKKIC